MKSPCKPIPALRCGFCLCLVSGGEHTTPEMVFVIHLLSAEQQPPVFQIAAPFLEVSQGGRATIGECGAWGRAWGSLPGDPGPEFPDTA